MKITSVIVKAGLACMAAGLMLTACNPNGNYMEEPDPVELKMISIPEGEFTKFDDQDFKTSVAAFKIAETEITREVYMNVMGELPSNAFQNEPFGNENQDKRPVDAVTWYDTLKFCNLLSKRNGLTPVYTINGSKDPSAWGTPGTSWEAAEVDAEADGYRLPTDSEWIYAALGTNAATYPGSSNDYFAGGIIGQDNIENYAWISTNSSAVTHEVGKKLPNSYGLYDMSGNVFEWCFDIHHEGENKRIRVGGEFSGDSASVNTRWDAAPDADWHIGFRVVTK